MTDITTSHVAGADRAGFLHGDLEPGAQEAAAPSTGAGATDGRGHRRLSSVVAIGISAGAAVLAVIAIATDDVGSEPSRPVAVAVAQPVVDEPVPDGLPCPENPIRGRAAC